MLSHAVKYGISFKYVLADSWFTCESLIHAVRELCGGAVHYIGLVKMNPKLRYQISTSKRPKHIHELIAIHERTTSHYCRKYRCKYIQLHVKMGEAPVRIFIIKCVCHCIKKLYIAVVIAVVSLLTACDKVFNVHPYDVNIKGEKNINAKQIALIEERIHDNETIRFAFISDTHQWFDDTKAEIRDINRRSDIDFVVPWWRCNRLWCHERISLEPRPAENA